MLAAIEEGRSARPAGEATAGTSARMPFFLCLVHPEYSQPAVREIEP